MSLARHMAAQERLRSELNEALRERDSARNERDAARLVVAEQADAIREADGRIGYLTGERDELDTAHRAALADLAEAYRDLAQARLDLFNERDHVPVYVDQVESVRLVNGAAEALREQPDMDRCG